MTQSHDTAGSEAVPSDGLARRPFNIPGRLAVTFRTVVLQQACVADREGRKEARARWRGRADSKPRDTSPYPSEDVMRQNARRWKSEISHRTPVPTFPQPIAGFRAEGCESLEVVKRV